MIKFQTDIEINRPISQVFNYVADLTNYGKWSSMSTTSSSAGPVRVGTKFTMSGREGESSWEVTAFEQNQRLAMKGSGRGMDFVADFVFAPSSTGTRLHYVFNVQPKGLMKLLEPFMGGDVKKEEINELNKLKALLEA